MTILQLSFIDYPLNRYGIFTFMSNAKTVSRILLPALSFLLLAGGSQILYAYQEQPAPPSQGGDAAPAPQSAEQIQALVAPIALYPDALVAQVLSAATFPDQVSQAQNWLQQHSNLTGQSLMQEVDKQPWDPSVKALAAFPTVLSDMAKNLGWTSELGEVYHFQAKDVMAAVQTLRAKAEAAGNLKSSQQITVVQQSPSTIVIQPASPQVVYVPQYNPAVVYGTPYTVPGYTAGEVAAASAISFGAGIALGAMMSGGCCSWGWNTWNVNWHNTTVVYGGHPYYGSAAWHGPYGAYGYHGYGAYGGAAYHGPAGSAGTYHGYGPGGAYHTGGAYQSAYGGAAARTTYAPDGAVHTSGGGYSNVTGQAYHYGASQTAAGGTAYHGTTNTGQHVAGGTTAGGQHWNTSGSGGWAHDNGASARAASSRGWSSARASGGFHGRR
jgi:hypothetical protein